MKNSWNLKLSSPKDLSRERINHYFRSKKNFECINGKHEYFNLDTGVQFSFFHCPKSNEVQLFIDLESSNSATIREAVSELKSLTKKFNLLISYTGKKEDYFEFEVNTFIQKWHEIKRDYLDFHYNSVNYPVPSEKIKTSWYWNYSSQWTKRSLKSLFNVPKIQYFNRYGKVNTIAVINLNCWNAIPEADYYRLTQVLPKNLFRRSEEVLETLVSRKEFEVILGKCHFLPFEKTPLYKMRPEDFKAQLSEFFVNGLKPVIKIIEPSKIIDKEIFEIHKSSMSHQAS